MAKAPKTDRTDAGWPEHDEGEHAVTELVATHQGSLSPFGTLTFPLPRTPYQHPVTVINK